MGLRDRLPKHDTIAQFDQARIERWKDADALAKRGRRYGGVYLLGYFVEMTLKAAFFRYFGLPPDTPIVGGDLKAATQLAIGELGVSEDSESQHNPVFWARAIVLFRESFDDPLPDEFALQLVWRSQRLKSNWAVAMRYRQVHCTIKEWQDIHEDAHWINLNYTALAGVGSAEC